MVTINKLWEGSTGTTGDLQDKDNWQYVSLVNSVFKWTASGSGTNEYYLEVAAGGDPGIVEPQAVYEGGTVMVAGAVGSLAAGEWDYGDNDTLGFPTIYVRLTSGAADPDSRDTDYVQLRDIPRTGDKVRVPAGSGIISSNLDLSGTTLVDWVFEEGHSAAVGTAADYLRLKLSGLFRFHSTGQAYVDLSDSAVAPQILGTAQGGVGTVGLELMGSALTTIRVENGSVGLAFRHGTSATVTTLRQTGGTVVVGAGATVTTIAKEGGTCIQRASATTVTNYAGTCKTEEAAAITTLNQEGGNFLHNSTGTIGTANADGGTLDAIQGTITTLNHAKDVTVKKRSGATITTHNLPSAPYSLEAKSL